MNAPIDISRVILNTDRLVLRPWREADLKDFYEYASCVGRVPSAHIGYCIGKNWWHHGIMTEALQTVIGYLFDEVGFSRIESMHDPNNPHSGAVMRKCGMTFEGTHRKSDRNNQGICDASYYAILAEEYRR